MQNTISLFNPDEQYRCTIIRGKTQTEMDNLLSVYAGIIAEICPCSKSDFDSLFNEKLSQALYKKSFEDLEDKHKKTIRNHVTETAGALFGLYYYDVDGNYYESPSNAKLLEDEDQPAFFKNLCLNFQFPNGSQKVSTILERINDGIHLKPFHFVLALLVMARKSNLFLTKEEVSYYVLNAKQVLQGKISVSQVFEEIVQDRKNHIVKNVETGSRHRQHINEQINLLVLANLVIEKNKVLFLNEREMDVITYFIQECDTPLSFNVFAYDLNDKQGKAQIRADWSLYYGQIAVTDDTMLTTSLKALTQQTSLEDPTDDVATKPIPTKFTNRVDKNALGEEGESYVFDFEKQRVGDTHPRLVNQVRLLASQRGIGYDISSVEAGEDLENPEYLRMIEVKATKRVTAPNISDDSWIDTINLTRREWMTAKQHRKAYNIYRIYFTPSATIIRKINNPYEKYEQGTMDVVATTYRAEFKSVAIDREYV